MYPNLAQPDQLRERRMRRASLARGERDQAHDRGIPMPVDRAKINFANDVTTRTVEREPRRSGAKCGTDGRCEQRLGAACASRGPWVEQPRRGAVLGALEGTIRDGADPGP